MTKSELVEQVADRAELTKQDASRAVDAVLATVEDALRRGSDVTVSGFGKFHVSERGARDGRQPAHRRAHPDRGLARAALHRGQRPEERGEGSLKQAPSFGDTLAARVAERESQIVLGVDPDPGDAVAGRRGRRAGGAARRAAAAAAVLAHCRALIDATAEACVAVKLQLARFEVLGARRLDAAAERWPRTRAARACW